MKVLCVLVLLVACTQAGIHKRSGNRQAEESGKGVPHGPHPIPEGLPVTKQDSCESYPCLIFEDEFDTFNHKNWQHEITAGGGGNWEFQYYTNNRTNSYVKDGQLYLLPTLTSERFGEPFLSSGTLDLWGNVPEHCTGNAWWGCSRQGTGTNFINPCQSAKIRSIDSMALRYGSVEVRAKMPQGDWIWPAIWMMPRRAEYGGWPASGEIDIVEVRGNADITDGEGNHRGVRTVGSAMHWGPYLPYNGYDKTHGARTFPTHDFHTYRIDWDEDAMVFFVDNEELMRAEPPSGGFWEMGDWGELGEESNPWRHDATKMAPFDREFYLMMNVAVGGTGGYFPDDWNNAGYQKPWNNESPTGPRDFWQAVNNWYPTWQGEDAAMQVDYVRVWKLKADD